MPKPGQWICWTHEFSHRPRHVRLEAKPHVAVAPNGDVLSLCLVGVPDALTTTTRAAVCCLVGWLVALKLFGEVGWVGKGWLRLVKVGWGCLRLVGLVGSVGEPINLAKELLVANLKSGWCVSKYSMLFCEPLWQTLSFFKKNKLTASWNRHQMTISLPPYCRTTKTIAICSCFRATLANGHNYFVIIQLGPLIPHKTVVFCWLFTQTGWLTTKNMQLCIYIPVSTNNIYIYIYENNLVKYIPISVISSNHPTQGVLNEFNTAVLMSEKPSACCVTGYRFGSTGWSLELSWSLTSPRMKPWQLALSLPNSIGRKKRGFAIRSRSSVPLFLHTQVLGCAAGVSSLRYNHGRLPTTR